MIIKPDLVLTALRNLYNILQPGGVLAASIMTLWKPDDPFYTEWKKRSNRLIQWLVIQTNRKILV
jgi:hypothetical protein